MCIHAFLWVVICICAFRWPENPEDDIGSLGAGVISSCELLDMGAGDQTQVLFKDIHALNLWPLFSACHAWKKKEIYFNIYLKYNIYVCSYICLYYICLYCLCRYIYMYAQTCMYMYRHIHTCLYIFLSQWPLTRELVYFIYEKIVTSSFSFFYSSKMNTLYFIL